MKRSALVALCVVALLFLSGCTTLSGEITVGNKDLETGDSTDIQLNIQYAKYLSQDKVEDLKIKILTGEDLQVLKDGQVIEEDVIRNVTKDVNVTYTLRADSYINTQQKVETVQFVVSSSDKTVKLTSDFILIRR